MMSSVVWGVSCLIILLCCARSVTQYHPIGSHPLPAALVSGQPSGAALLSYTVVPCPHVLQVIMALPIRSSYWCHGNTQA
jgi:hypothetical protein